MTESLPRFRTHAAWFATAALAVSLCGEFAQADLREQIRGCLARALKRVMVDPVVADYTGKTLVLHDAASPQKPFEMKLVKSLGSGFSGRVYDVELKGLALPDHQGEDVVAKLAHRNKFTEPHPKANIEKDRTLEKEDRLYRLLLSHKDAVWNHPIMQAKTDTWEKGTLPIVKILAKVDTESGTILIKQKLKGTSLSQIHARYGHRIEDLPPDMRRALKDVYDFAQAVHGTVRVEDPLKGALMYSPDIKPENFMWVDDAAAMATYGLKKPGFVFVEFTHYHGKRWAYDGNLVSPSEYEQIFSNYLKFNAD